MTSEQRIEAASAPAPADWGDLPEGLLHRIISKLGGEHSGRLSAVCRSWKALADQKPIRLTVYCRTGPRTPVRAAAMEDLASLSRFANLTELDLSASWPDTVLQGLPALPQLRTLKLGQCRFDIKEAAAFFTGCSQLSSLSVSFAYDQYHAFQRAVEGLPALETMELLNQHDSDDIGLQILAGMTSLRSISIVAQDLHFRGIENYTWLSRLSDLRFNIGRCGDHPEAPFSNTNFRDVLVNCANLVELHITHDNTENALKQVIAMLPQLTSLQRLGMQGCSWDWANGLAADHYDKIVAWGSDVLLSWTHNDTVSEYARLTALTALTVSGETQRVYGMGDFMSCLPSLVCLEYHNEDPSSLHCGPSWAKLTYLYFCEPLTNNCLLSLGLGLSHLRSLSCLSLAVHPRQVVDLPMLLVGMGEGFSADVDIHVREDTFDASVVLGGLRVFGSHLRSLRLPNLPAPEVQRRNERWFGSRLGFNASLAAQEVTWWEGLAGLCSLKWLAIHLQEDCLSRVTILTELSRLTYLEILGLRASIGPELDKYLLGLTALRELRLTGPLKDSSASRYNQIDLCFPAPGRCCCTSRVCANNYQG